MSKPDRYLNLTDTARRFGISRKALRVYEAKGLVLAERTAAGWRVYGPEQIKRLQQVIALKSFGLSLGRIAELLSGRDIDLAKFLTLHEAMLQRQKEDVDRALHLVVSARARLASEGSISSDDLINLTRNIMMTDAQNVASEYEAIASKHLTEDDQITLLENGFDGMDKPDPVWDALIAEGKQIMQTCEPDSAEAMDLARRWMEQVNLATGGSRDLNEKVREVAREMHQQPHFQEATPSSPDLMDFIGRAYGAAIAAGIEPKP